LARLITAWPHLPAHVHQTIATLVAAAAPGIAQAAMNTAEADAGLPSPTNGLGGVTNAVSGLSEKDRPTSGAHIHGAHNPSLSMQDQA
jgi:hypothetical protein